MTVHPYSAFVAGLAFRLMAPAR